MANEFPPASLFYYADLAGFQEILEKKAIRLSPLDPQATLYAALSFIKQLITTEYPGLSADLFNIDAVSSSPEYSFSLTTQKDLASQWQKYYPDGGYAIAIDQDQLSATIDAYNLGLFKCLYDEGEKKDFVTKTIVAISPKDYTDSIGATDPTCVLDKRSPMFAKEIDVLNLNILNYAGLLKDPALEQEQEWRILVSYVSPGPLTPEAKAPGENNSAAPWLQALLLTDPDTKVSIKEVVIGPNPDMAQAKLACQALLIESAHAGSVVITESSVPYQP